MSVYYTTNDNALNEARHIISQKSPDELIKLMNSDDELTKLISNLNEVQQLEIIKESSKENIKRIALRNLDQEPILLEEKRKLEEIYEELKRCQEQYKSVKQQYEEQAADINPEMIWVLLQTAASELERTTEESADDFFLGQRSEEEVTEFERRFIEDRKRVHELKIKADKFHEFMQLSQSTSYLHSNSHGHVTGHY